MTPEAVKQLIETALPGSEAVVGGDGSHFDVTVVSDAFDGQSAVKRQQTVYATLGERITSGEIHAINMRTFTPDEWRRAQSLNVRGDTPR